MNITAIYLLISVIPIGWVIAGIGITYH
ncbi:gp229 [Mycobacterium phage Omega]|uniref:Uncharacterized protein n=3 Tax=Omegavirus TaxID=1623292 RepID=Q853T8_BPMOM|nr:gp229 [Mycobacterium phage Omega]YP_008410376.1 hypothetical protein N860_gp189 [Mycobacterium phage Redno2]YP_009047024.1 hypothetical protein N857_gp196 [Mycobacterium phage Wanda]YP_009124178.1 hypothetical protein VC71_gp197 [Mycobacterium phage Minerva]YP_009213451.1 hypothetical protein AVV70_gp203 [Mycobacterium phage MiaZeal]YP_009636404.1 hypothetical protein FGG20_gp199 [Mycobacterium phage Baka]ASD50833.1 hypothetical protein PORCELAIN_227 [Mycobacterium phage Porcelain]ATN8994